MDWIKLPSMDEFAVNQWLKSQDDERPIALLVRGRQERKRELANISSAFFRVSQGHPLYLIYALRELVSKGKEISIYEIEALPLCPDGDIRSYYDVLWARLPATARDILHAIAGSEFFWPSQGIQECFGNFSDINFLLESRSAGMVPFHPSIFAYVRDRQDHSDTYAVLLPKIADWLDTQAHEYWRWGWLWLVQAKMGNSEPLLRGACRDWVVSSLVKGWPEKQIARILLAAETIAFEQGDLPKTVKLRSIRDRVINVREYQSADYAKFWITALTISDNRHQMSILIENMQDLSADEIVSIVKLCPAGLRSEVAKVGLDELGRRINTRIELRYKPEYESRNLPDCLLSVAAFAGVSIVPHLLRYLRGFENPAPLCNKYIELLSASHDIETLLAVRRWMRGKKCSQQRQLIQDHILRLTLFKGANPRPLIKTSATDLTPFTASWLIRAGIIDNVRLHASPPPEDVLKERYSFGSNSKLSRYFYNFFWTALCVALQAKGNFSLLYPSRDSNELGWLENALVCLEDVARKIAAGKCKASYSTIYIAADTLESLDHVDPNNRDGAQFRAFKNCLPDIALDLHLFGLTDQHQPQISMQEFALACRTLHWVDELWIEQNMKNRLPLLDRPAADVFVQERNSTISGRVSEFSERSDQWTELASLAILYKVQDPTALISRAADCLIGYGWRKDLRAIDVLDAIQQVHASDGSRTEEWLSVVTPIVDEITNFTDGDETGHVRSELINTFAATIPECLTKFYTRHISRDEWRYADKTLEAALKTIDLSSKSAAGLCSTLLDDKTLQVLEERGRKDPIAASLMQKQIDFLARSQPMAGADEQDNDALRPEEETTLQQDPTAIGSNNFGEFVNLISAPNFPYKYRSEFFQKWLNYWQAQGKASIALNSIGNFFDDENRYLNADDFLDQAFEVSLAEEGKEVAYSWLVRAHIHRHGWQSQTLLAWGSEEEVMKRLERVASIYPEKWQDFIRDTSGQATYFRYIGHGFSIGRKYLVRFLILVNQVDIASAVTDEFVRTLTSEVKDQPIPDASWLRGSNDVDLACELLFERLKWPVPFVRWKAARAIRDLLNDVTTRDSATLLLLHELEKCPTESETCSLLTVILLTDSENRPTHADVIDRIDNPSALSDNLLHQIYATELKSQTWRSAHSGQAPLNFEPDGYFLEHKKSHVPAIFFNSLEHLESETGKPFLRQWAFEWKQLRDRTGTRFTRYPNYFGDPIDRHRGIFGQYLQRQNEVYRSAYCRVLAIALDRQWIPAEIATEYCSCNMPVIAGLCEIDPGRRPAWLADIPERALADESDLQNVAHELIKASQANAKAMVSLHTPFRKGAAPYGHLSVKAFFVTGDFQLGDDSNLYSPRICIPLSDYFDLRGRKPELRDDPVVQEGLEGQAIPVCEALLPMPFGYWMGDYFSVGLSAPASYCLPANTVLQCSASRLEFINAGSTIAFTHIWHDDWSPQRPRDGHTRCGVATFMDALELAKVQAKMGYHFGWLIEKCVWMRESDHGEFKLSKRRAFVIESRTATNSRGRQGS